MSICPFVWWLVLHVCVNCGSEPPIPSMRPQHYPTPIHPLAGHRKNVIYEYTQTLQEITLDFVSCLFQGQKPGLTDVQAELDRMTRKQDSMVSANNIPPPTENEAWKQQKQLHRPLQRLHVHASIKRNWPNSQCLYQPAHTEVAREWVQMLSDILVWWDGKRERMKVFMRW